MPSLRALHERFVRGDVDAGELEAAPLSAVVAQSWRRSLANGVDPDAAAAPTLSAEIAELRQSHPLAAALPLIRQLLVEDAAYNGALVAISAADGTLLWVEGASVARSRAESMNFVPGSNWSEQRIGTNAPGTALALGREVQINSAEHYVRAVQPWSCTAVPVRARNSGAILGAIDVTSGGLVASPQTLALVRATAVAVENHLALLGLPRETPTTMPRLTVLGAARARWTEGALSTALTGRHAEILVLLGAHREGLTADHLAVLLEENDLDGVTVRAEMSRLRKVIGADYLGSRPYQLLRPLASDLTEVAAAIEAGDLDAALNAYQGPLLPQSVSPAISRLRTQLSAGLRSAVLQSGNLRALRRWLDLPEGRDDRTGWQLLHDASDTGSPMRAAAGGHLAGIDFELG